MKISYHGHSVVKIETEGKTILIDPFINGNPLCDLKVEEQMPDAILLTHGHNDHFGDTIPIAKQSGALVVAPNELANYISWQGVNAHPMHIGGSRQFDFGKVKFTQAFHGSSYVTENNDIIYTGMPGGIMFMAEGLNIWHTGDTALFSDLKLLAERHPVDVLLIPIGDNFTMGPDDAAYAVSLIKPKIVVPIHYNTFDYIKVDPQYFASLVEDAEVQILKPGEYVKFE
ncbi:metal-dependent hydrolase [Lysinibacillus sp. LZ02]|uniref:metal-dependent hydrolase n=1 Tax=Lysinibacillus sp. LZ02 TaxID=3420668 RepID=UPI003D36B391